MILRYLVSKVRGRGAPADLARLYREGGERVATLLAPLAEQPLVPLEEIQAPPRLSARPLEALLSSGWSTGGQLVDLRSPDIPWSMGDRPDAFALHSWNPIGYLLMEHSDRQKQAYFATSLAFAGTWLRNFFADLAELSLDDAVAAVTAREASDLAWQDMAVGTRVYRLAYILDVLARDTGDRARDDLVLFFRALVLHLKVLEREDFFNHRTNHGLYQALGHLAASRRFEAVLPSLAAHRGLAESRLSDIASRMFFPSGAHAEHSPGYHFLVLGTFVGARNSGLLSDLRLLRTIEAAEEVLMWMLQPDGSLVSIGDTDLKRGYRAGNNAERFANERLRYVLSGGRMGEAPRDGIVGFRDAGYAFGRAIRPGDYARSTYFAQIAGFHSRTHKHADHLSFVWIEHGERILIDPGKYGFVGKTELGDALSEQGFFYDDPRRVHVEKTRAHNCVEIDGRDQPRRNVPFFGSALKLAEEHDGLWITVCEVMLGDVRHIRIVFVKPAHFLVCADWLCDDGGAEHDFRQWFQLAPEWRAEASHGCLAAEHAGTGLRLRAAGLLPGAHLGGVHRGRAEPALSGWSSDAAKSLVPSPSAEWVVEQSAAAAFATVFSLSDSLVVEPDAARIGHCARSGFLRWTDDRGRHALRFERPAAEDAITVSLASQP